MNDFVTANIDEAIALLSELIEARTENPPGNEYLAANVVISFLERYGIPYETFEKESGRTNVVSTLGAGERTLLFAAHSDVVPAGDG